MSEITHARLTSPGLDESLANILSQQLGRAVQLHDPSDPGCHEIVARAVEARDEAILDDGCGEQVMIAMKLPAGAVAVWQCDPDSASLSGRHGKAVLALQAAENEKKQLQAEVDALATQVVNDFEELSLIRSLAASMELPTQGDSGGDLALRSLTPLADGVGAEAIAAVFLSEDGEVMGEPIWSSEAVATTQTIHRLIQQFREEAACQPVVRNNLTQAGELIDQTLNEFVLVQCRSEGRLHGWVVACNRVEDATENVPWGQLGFTTVQASLMETATNQLAAQLHNLRLLRQKEELFTDVVRALVNAVEARDPYTCGHSERVARFAKCLASAAGQSAAACERIYLTGLLHDVGKIAIPDGVLQKPGHLDENERAIIETHTDAGWRILHELEALQDVLPGVLYHHEHFDGNGYPDGLVGENIPIDGRILAVCDAFDAMTSNRPYREGMSIDRAIEILKGGAGKYWDPTLIGAFIRSIDEINLIRVGHRPREQANRPAPTDGRPVILPVP